MTEIRQLTGLRGFLALNVVVGHYNLATALPYAQHLIFFNSAVDFFFCLSGFMLSYAYGAGSGQTLDLTRYSVSRFARIYPVYLLSLLLILALSSHWHEGNFAYETGARVAGELAAQLALIGALPLPATAGFWNVPSWSVSVDLFCYVCIFPLLFRASSALRSAPRWLFMVLTVAAVACDFLFFRAYFNPVVLGIGYPAPDNPWAWWVAIVRGATMFTAGWLAYVAQAKDAVLARFLARVVDWLAVLLAGAILFGPTDNLSRQLLVFFMPFLIAGLMSGTSWAAKILATAPAVFLGRISYSLYLLHVPILAITAHSRYLNYNRYLLFSRGCYVLL